MFEKACTRSFKRLVRVDEAEVVEVRDMSERWSGECTNRSTGKTRCTATVHSGQARKSAEHFSHVTAWPHGSNCLELDRSRHLTHLSSSTRCSTRFWHTVHMSHCRAQFAHTSRCWHGLRSTSRSPRVHTMHRFRSALYRSQIEQFLWKRRYKP